MKRYGLLMLLTMVSAASHAETRLGYWDITLKGKVLASSCDLDSSSAQQTVHLGSFASTAFKNVGDTTTDAPLDITLTNCGENIVGAKITFSGTQDADNPQLLALTDTGSGSALASGVAVELMDKSRAVIPINSTTAQYPLGAGNNTLNFLLHYKATRIPVSGGNGTAVMYFDVSYQ
ncbi:fimbrial protein [Enterobacter soli]|uniref:fimbrial protein n=1 Tax=Enterobacter soli TaxID=885040 RepID=UPI0034CF3841